MKRITKIGLIATAGAAIMALGIGGAALAANPATTTTQAATTPGSFYGMMGQAAMPWNVCYDAISKLMGLTTQEIQTQQQAGKSLVQIAAAQGVNEDTLVNTIQTACKTALQTEVTAGTITQAQADQMVQNMQQCVRLMVEQTGAGCGMMTGSLQNAPGITAGCPMFSNSTANATTANGTASGYGMMGRGTVTASGQTGYGMMSGGMMGR